MHGNDPAPFVQFDGSTLSLHCDLDMDTAPAVSHALAVMSGDVTVDLAHVPFMDSTGLRCLLTAKRDAAARGCTVSFVNPQPNVLRVASMTGTLGELGVGLQSAAS